MSHKPGGRQPLVLSKISCHAEPPPFTSPSSPSLSFHQEVDDDAFLDRSYEHRGLRSDAAVA